MFLWKQQPILLQSSLHKISFRNPLWWKGISVHTCQTKLSKPHVIAYPCYWLELYWIKFHRDFIVWLTNIASYMNQSPQTQRVTNTMTLNHCMPDCHLQAEETLGVVKSTSNAFGDLQLILLFYLPEYLSCFPVFHREIPLSPQSSIRCQGTRSLLEMLSVFLFLVE